MDLDKYLDRQDEEKRNENLAKYLKISVDELNQIFEGDGAIERDLLNDTLLNGYFIYFIDNPSKEITNKIDGYIEDGNFVWVPTSVAFGQNDAEGSLPTSSF